MTYSFPWLRKQYWDGLRKLNHINVYHVSSLDDLTLDNIDFTASFSENLSSGLPTYLRLPSQKVLRDEQFIYKLYIDHALALKVAAQIISQDDSFTQYDFEVAGQLSRWGLSAIAHPKNIDVLLEKYEPNMPIDVVLYSQHIAIVRHPSVIKSFERVYES